VTINTGNIEKNTEKISDIEKAIAEHSNEFKHISKFISDQDTINMDLYKKVNKNAQYQIEIDGLAKSNRDLTRWIIKLASGIIGGLIVTLIGHWIIFSYSSKNNQAEKMFELYLQKQTTEKK